MTTITLDLPEQTMEQARQAAAVLQRPVEAVLADMVQSVLPEIHDAPAEIRAELTEMTWLDNQALWDVARRMMSPRNEKRMRLLSELQGERELTTAEEEELEGLRREYGRITLLKARAYALLSLRAGKPLSRIETI